MADFDIVGCVDLRLSLLHGRNEMGVVECAVACT
jgi:hypothetical protein